MRPLTVPAIAALAVGATLLFPLTAHADNPPIAGDPAGPQAPMPSLPPPAPAPPAAPTTAKPIAPQQTPQPGQAQAQTPPANPSDSCAADPCASDCACARRCCSKACRCDKKPKLELSVTGIRASVTHVDTGTVKDSTLGVGFAGAAESYALDGTVHGSSYFMLGGGEGGFEGALSGTIDLGYRIPVAEDHGPFARIGFDGRLQGNDLLYFSMLELPRVTVGWQYLHGKTVLEAGARGGAILAGLYDPAEDGRRKLNGFEWGGFVSAQADFLRADASFMRIEGRKTLDGTPIDVGRAALCVVGGNVGLCVDGMLFHGNAEMRANAGGIHSTSSQYVGLTLGITGL